MRRTLAGWPLALALALAGCTVEQVGGLNTMSSFRVTVLGVFERQGMNRVELAVVSDCIDQYGSAAMVPAEVKGQPGCPYQIPRGEVEFDLRAQALALDGTDFTDFNRSVAFRVIPGDLSSDQRSRWALANLGLVEATVKAIHPYGQVRVWVEDAPPKSVFDGGALLIDVLPPEPAYPERRTFASGTSQTIHFADQTLQSLQVPGGLDPDNRSSPFVGEFVTVGKDPTSGSTLKQSCTDDPLRDGREALMVVTGLDPSGFFVTDISACRLAEFGSFRTAEEPEACLVDLGDGGTTPIEAVDGGAGTCGISRRTCARRADCRSYLPGTFASMFVYNYNFPDGLDEGDLLFTLSGSVQEFTSTTQLVFPSWSVAERVRRLPPEQWNKWLQFARPFELKYRQCGVENAAVPFLTDQLCGHNRRNLKMESLESGLVRVRRVRFPQVFRNCDFNANGEVPFFCESPGTTGEWSWTTCNFDGPEPEADRVERVCNHECVIGQNDYAGVICSEEATFRGFGQFVIELAPPGPARLGLDDSTPTRIQTVQAQLGSATDGGPVVNPTVRAGGYGAGAEVAITCSEPTRWKAGDGTVTVSDTDAVIQPDQVLRHPFTGPDTTIGFQAIAAPATCTVGLNTRVRLNLVTKDAVPELNPACSVDDPDADKAEQCRFLKGAEFDVTGHLRQVQPARPRWVLIPRAPDDLCCYPGPGLSCPRPIQPCQ